MADLEQHLPQEIVSHGLPRVSDTLLVKELLVLFQREMYFLKLATGKFGLLGSAKTQLR